LKENQKIHELRRHPRYPISENPNFSVYFRVSKDDSLNRALPINISMGGMMLSSDEPHRPHTRIEVTIFYSDNSKPAIFLQGTVCWMSKVPDTEDESRGYYVGIQFSGISELQTTVLDKFITTYVLDQ